MKKVLLSVLGASAILAALLSTGCSTEPKGTEGKIIVSDTLPMGTANVDTITLKDADLGADTISVKVTSGADNAGIYLVLSGKSGVYKGVLSFSTAASTPNSTIQVIQNCLVTVTYKDAKPAGNRMESFSWKASATTVGVDKAATGYQGITDPMIITVTDPNISTQTVTVNVTSTHNTTPLAVTLTKSATVYGMYTGNVYFTVASTVTGADTLHVKDQDVVTVTYSNLVTPSMLDSAKTLWAVAATAIAVAPGAATYTGLKDSMVITVTDPNVTTPTVTVHLTSHKDATGIDVTLTLANGTYSGKVAVSLVQSGINVIGVLPPADTMTISYAAPAVAAPVIGASDMAGFLRFDCNGLRQHITEQLNKWQFPLQTTIPPQRRWLLM